MIPSDLIIQLLIKANVIPQGYTGQVILHVGCGGLCNIERRDKGEQNGLLDRLQGMNEKKYLDILSFSCHISNNTV